MKYKISKYAIKITESEGKTVLFNSLSGEVINLDNDLYSIIIQSVFDETIPFFEELKQKRYIVPEAQDEFKLLRYNEILTQQTIPQTTLSYVIAPTSACNYRCEYCFEGKDHPKITMDSETITNVLRFIDDELTKNSSIENLFVTWFGGEPLLCMEEICTLGEGLKNIAIARDVKFSSSIITNGVFFTKSNVDLLVEKCNLESAQITFDGTVENYCKIKRASVADYHAVLKNIADNYETIEIKIRLNGNKKNIDDIYRLIDQLYSEMGFTDKLRVYLAQIINYGIDSEDDKFFTYQEYKDEVEKIEEYLNKKQYISTTPKRILPCHSLVSCKLAHKNNYAIGPRGELYKCEQHIGDLTKIVGNVTEGLLYTSCYFDYILGVIDSRCSECSVYPICNYYARCPQLHKTIAKNDTKSCCVYETVLAKIKKRVLRDIE